MENLRDYMKHLMQYFVISTAFILMQYLELPREVQYTEYSTSKQLTPENKFLGQCKL